METCNLKKKKKKKGLGVQMTGRDALSPDQALSGA